MYELRLEVSFNITDFSCSADEITACLGVNCSESWRKGDVIQGSTCDRRFNGWMLRSPLTEPDLERHVGWLLERLPGDLEKLRNVTDDWESELACAVYARDETPALNIPNNQIQRLAKLGTGIDIDLYVLSE